MSRLDELRQSGFSDIVQVLDKNNEMNWDKQKLLNDIRQSRYQSDVFMRFGVWLYTVANKRIESMTNDEITSYFNVYFFSLLKLLEGRRKRTIYYVDLVDIYNRELKRLTMHNDVYSIVYVGNVDWCEEIFSSSINKQVDIRYSEALKNSLKSVEEIMES